MYALIGVELSQTKQDWLTFHRQTKLSLKYIIVHHFISIMVLKSKWRELLSGECNPTVFIVSFAHTVIHNYSIAQFLYCECLYQCTIYYFTVCFVFLFKVMALALIFQMSPFLNFPYGQDERCEWAHALSGGSFCHEGTQFHTPSPRSVHGLVTPQHQLLR